MEEGGFEPPKAKPADLQSVPFGHLGTPPYELDGVPAKPSAAGFVGKGDAVKRPGFRRSRKQGMCNLHRRGGAGGRIRTPDLLITNQLLYQLSYTSSSSNRDYNSRCVPFCQHFFRFLLKKFCPLAGAEKKIQRTRQVPRVNRARMGKISSRPASISKDSTSLERSE